MKRQKERLERLKQDVEEEKARALEAARERVLKDFEKGHLSLCSNLKVASTTSGSDTKECESSFFPSCDGQ